MSIVYSNVSNGNFTVCCMGQTVYVYKKTGSELARFTLVKADFAAISPDGDTFAVKSSDGCLALYSFSQLARTATLKFSDKSTQMEKGMCFSADGKKLYNVEYDANGSALSVYDMDGGTTEKYIFDGAEITHIECNDDIFAIGSEGEKVFAAKIIDGKLSDVKYVSSDDYDCCYNCKCAEVRGFSSAAVEYYLPKVENIDDSKITIKDLWDKTEE